VRRTLESRRVFRKFSIFGKLFREGRRRRSPSVAPRSVAFETDTVLPTDRSVLPPSSSSNVSNVSKGLSASSPGDASAEPLAKSRRARAASPPRAASAAALVRQGRFTNAFVPSISSSERGENWQNAPRSNASTASSNLPASRSAPPSACQVFGLRVARFRSEESNASNAATAPSASPASRSAQARA
jgi:hypothetical protein